jgi:hypothetical protein
MTVNIVNRPWVLSRRSLLAGAAALPLAACGIDFAQLGPVIAGDIQSGAAALLAGLAEVTSLSASVLPANWAATLAQIKTWVGDIQAIASSVSATTLVSTAGGTISNYIHDFNAIVEAIISNPVVAGLVSSTGFGWALTALAALLPLAENAVNIIINILQPPAPTPVPATARRGVTSRLRARLAAPMSPELARLILQEVIATGH